jgi:hypothetical protein
MIGQLVVAKGMPLLLQAPQTGPDQLTPEQRLQMMRESMAWMERLDAAEGPITSILALLVPFALFALIFGIIWLAYRNRQAKIRAQAEFNKQLLDKFGSGREFSEFLESKGSQRFLDAMWSQGPGRHGQVLATLRTGIVMTALGLGFLVLSWWTRGMRFPGVIVLALGAGFLISAAISHRLSKRWEEKAASEVPPGS